MNDNHFSSHVTPTVARLWALAREIGVKASQWDNVSPQDAEWLYDTQIKLRAYAKLLGAADRRAFLQAEIDDITRSFPALRWTVDMAADELPAVNFEDD